MSRDQLALSLNLGIFRTGTLSVCAISESVEKVKPSPLDGLFFVIYAVGSVLAETPTSGNNIDTSGENNSTIKDTKMLVSILLVLITVLFLQAFNIIKLNQKYST